MMVKNATILDHVHQFADSIIKEMYREFILRATHRRKYPSAFTADQRRGWDLKGKRLVKRLFSMFNNDPDRFEEATATSTIGKGKIIRFCVRDPKTDATYDIDTLKFVFLHELSHIVTEDIGHESDKFWSNFKFLLTFAALMNMYKPIKYTHSSNYCGIVIGSNPYFHSHINVLL
jgi:hypothetical protein